MQIQTVKHCYIHVPFCRSICYYCDFKRTVYNHELVNQWLLAIGKEIQHYKTYLTPHCFETIYIGGGTPSALTHEQLSQLISYIKDYVGINCEFSMEANPEDINIEKLSLWKRLGINRISIGVESSESSMLKKMNRSEAALDLPTLIPLIRNHGINNISFDVMYGLPHQSLADYKKTLDFALSLDPDHISAYCLTIEDHSVWAKQGIQQVDDDLAADMLEYTHTFLQHNGFYRYEVSNYARNNLVSKHNLGYWLYDDFIAFGYGGSGKLLDKRYDHCDQLKDYLSDPVSSIVWIEEENSDIKQDYLMMNLRLKQPFLFHRYNEKFNEDFYQKYHVQLEKLKTKGYLEYTNHQLIMTDLGLDCLFSVLVDLFE